MNKTLKTIAWVCVVLGIMGMLAILAILGFGQINSADRRAQTLYSVMKTPEFNLAEYTSDCILENEEGESYINAECIAPKERNLTSRKLAIPRLRPQGRIFSFRPQRGFLPYQPSSPSFFLVLLFASGPVLTAVGAVILIVNREPRKKENGENIKTDKNPKFEGQP